MTLHRFFLPSKAFAAIPLQFPSETEQQIRRVLRLTSGDKVIALDGSGWEYVVRMTVTSDSVTGEILERRLTTAEPCVSVTLYQGLLKAAKFELVLQKCTEVGVSVFVPVQTARAVAGEPSSARQQRFVSILREAAEQSGRGRVPSIEAPMRFQEAVAQAVSRGPVILLWEEERGNFLSEIGASLTSQDIALFIGPEGGFTATEAVSARESGAHIATLGPRILRAETAAIVASALLVDTFRDAHL